MPISSAAHYISCPLQPHLLYYVDITVCVSRCGASARTPCSTLPTRWPWRGRGGRATWADTPAPSSLTGTPSSGTGETWGWGPAWQPGGHSVYFNTAVTSPEILGKLRFWTKKRARSISYNHIKMMQSMVYLISLFMLILIKWHVTSPEILEESMNKY